MFTSAEQELRDRIIAEIRQRTEANNGIPPRARNFERETGIVKRQWQPIFSDRWSNVLAEAGLPPRRSLPTYTRESVLESYVEACRHFKHVPTDPELRRYRRLNGKFPHLRTIITYLGLQPAILDQLEALAARDPKAADLKAMVDQRREVMATLMKSHPGGLPREPASEGCVYLVRSGVRYRLGRRERALEAGDREELVSQGLHLVHQIRTDDPPGIEAYWRNRFADRPADGEWLDLTAADMVAFRRRISQ